MKKLFLTSALALILAQGVALSPAFAAVSQLDTDAQEAILVDYDTSAVLFEKNADQHMPTSSMSKLMTAYLVFEALKTGKIHMEDTVTISEHAWRMEGSKMFVKVGDTVKVEDLIQGMIVQSGNDASVALAEAVAGSEDAFAQMMNDKAKSFGMANSHFVNATGLPDPQHYSTPRDLATLARHLIDDYPQYYHYYSQQDYTYNGIKQGNRNPLLYRNMGVDGMKTGHTDVAGYGLIASLKRGDRRIIMVANGMKSMQARADESAKILEWGMREYEDVKVVGKGDAVAELPVWYGTSKEVAVSADNDVKFTLPHGAAADITKKVRALTPLPAPIQKGQPVAELVISGAGSDEITVPLVAANDVPQLGFWGRIKRRLGWDS